MFNKLILIGNLTRDIELRYLPSGQALAKCGIATNRQWKDKMSGEQKTETMFIDFTVWGRSAEIAHQYLRKGSKVLLEGRLTLEQWTDQTGQKRSRHSVTVENLKMLDSRGNQENREEGYTPQQQSSAPAPKPQQGEYNRSSEPKELPSIDIDDEDIPF